MNIEQVQATNSLMGVGIGIVVGLLVIGFILQLFLDNHRD